MINIHDGYVEWANTLDSTGKDSTDAVIRLQNYNVLEYLHETLEVTEALAANADKLKKWVFYGKTSDDLDRRKWPLLSHQLQTASMSLCDHNTVRVLHAIIGLITEIGELITPFRLHVFEGQEMDWQNFTEEVGDLFWYMALLAKANGYGDFGPFLISNKAKLTKRYGDTWTQDGALNRDTGAEMEALDKSLQIPAIGGTFTPDEAKDFVQVLADTGAKIESTCDECGMVIASNIPNKVVGHYWRCTKYVGIEQSPCPQCGKPMGHFPICTRYVDIPPDRRISIVPDRRVLDSLYFGKDERRNPYIKDRREI